MRDARPTVDGSVPLSCAPNKLTTNSVRALNSCGGMVVASGLVCALNASSAGSAPSSDGSGPTSWFERTLNCSSAFIVPTSVGMEPRSALLYSMTSTTRVSRPIVLGMVPDSPLESSKTSLITPLAVHLTWMTPFSFGQLNVPVVPADSAGYTCWLKMSMSAARARGAGNTQRSSWKASAMRTASECTSAAAASSSAMRPAARSKSRTRTSAASERHVTRVVLYAARMRATSGALRTSAA
mmetsp:Transcript_53086/g.130146  ORF Transcript_53086/g.130146 Transcript_53086/m.130146 type:complete len:240 (-) Transcript_53086:752-1471(-)